jgi:GTPase SAR1 family protein/ribosomal protein L28
MDDRALITGQWIVIPKVDVGQTLDLLKNIFRGLLSGNLPRVLTSQLVGFLWNNTDRLIVKRKKKVKSTDNLKDGSKEKAVGRSIVIFNDYSQSMREGIQLMRRKVEDELRERNRLRLKNKCTILLVGQNGVGKASLVKAIFGRSLDKSQAKSLSLSMVRQVIQQEIIEHSNGNDNEDFSLGSLNNNNGGGGSRSSSSSIAKLNHYISTDFAARVVTLTLNKCLFETVNVADNDNNNDNNNGDDGEDEALKVKRKQELIRKKFENEIALCKEEWAKRGWGPDVILHVLDSTSADLMENEMKLVLNMFGCKKVIFVLNKIDAVNSDTHTLLEERIKIIYSDYMNNNSNSNNNNNNNNNANSELDFCKLFSTIGDIRKTKKVWRCDRCGSEELVINNVKKMAACTNHGCNWEISVAIPPEHFGIYSLVEFIASEGSMIFVSTPPRVELEKRDAWIIAQQISHPLKDGVVRNIIERAWDEAHSISESMSTSTTSSTFGLSTMSTVTSTSTGPSFSMSTSTCNYYNYLQLGRLGGDRMREVVNGVVIGLAELFGLSISMGTLARSNEPFWEGSAAGKLISMVVQLLQEQDPDTNNNNNNNKNNNTHNNNNNNRNNNNNSNNRVWTGEIFVAAFAFVLHDVMKRMSVCAATLKAVEKDVTLEERMRALKTRGLAALLDSMLILPDKLN